MSSFQKRIPKTFLTDYGASAINSKTPPGIRPSSYNGQPLISTGVLSFDDILGGGIPIGSVLLIAEDRNTSYAKLLMKYFIAQGFIHGNKILVTSGDDDPKNLVKGCMWISDREERGSEDDKLKGHGKKEKKPQDGEEDDDCSNDDEEEGNSEKMKIAWRYKGMKKLGSHVGVGLTLNKASTLPSISPLLTESPKQNQLSFCNTFDLTKRIPDAVLDSASLWPVDVSKLSLYDNLDRINENEGRNVYDHILSEIRNAISENSQMVSQNVLRVAIHSIASPMWPNASVEELFKFFHALRGILRSSNGTAVVTIPAYLYASHNSGLSDLHSSPLIRRVSHMCDALVGVESFAGSPKTCNTLYSAHYNGLFHVYKLPTLNSLLAPATKLSILSNGGGNQLGFKLRRKKFSIETFHLPPEGGVGERRVGGSSEVENAHENLKKPNVTEKNDDVSTFFPKKFGPRTGGFNIKSARLHHGKMGTAEETLEF